jgi:ABC-type Na+ efflux pump permease subunit
MKILDIAFKDLTHSFRSAFGVIFMFGMPLLVTGMFYVMFGNVGGNEGFNVPVTKVVITNLDQAGADFQAAMVEMPGGMQADSLGQVIVNVLQSPEFSKLLEVSLAADAETARAAVDNQQAGVAIIIPADFSTRFSTLDRQAVLELYTDPTLSLGPAIVRSVLSQFMDRLSGARIAVNLAISTTGLSDPALIGQVMQRYMAAQPQGDLAASLIETRAPTASKPPENFMAVIVGSIMGGMMIFYAFYTGTATAQTILKEEEERTLPRLFTTPTPEPVILGGKFLAVFLTVMVQVVVLLVAAHFVFRTEWGAAGSIALAAMGVILSASAFGIFVNSLLKSTRQGGFIFGGVLTMTGMLAMIPIFSVTNPNRSPWMEIIPLFVPQGWAVRLLFQSMNNAPANEIILTSLALLAWSAVFLVIGVWRFQRRYT